MARTQCTICLHEERARAEILLAKGDGFAATARKLGLSQDALERHWKRHVSEEARKALQPGAKALAARAELAAQVAEENVSVLDHFRAQRAALWRLFIAELEAGRTTVATLVSAQLSKVGNSIARITGELATSPLVQQTTIHMHFTEDPEFRKLMEEVAEALAPYAEARRAVFEKFRALERQDASPPVPALEHEQHEPTVPQA